MEAFALDNVINPFEEAIAYETLWAIQGMTEKKLADYFRDSYRLPSEILQQIKGIIPDEDLVNLEKEVREFLLKKKTNFSICINGDFQYPDDLRKAHHPIELFYFKGNLDLLSTKSLSIVGARKASSEGILRAKRLAKELVANDFTVVSGLAAGIDTSAQTSTIESQGKTIGVIGTPIDSYYPKENKELQDKISSEHLLISQVPFYRYANETFNNHKHYFPRRNITMASISLGTIIVEASDTSGSLTQARACIQQKKKLFILESCFQNKQIKWPAYFEDLGAIRVKSTDDILSRV
jgi:DNA processing protein